jgi:lipopolysaccharide/colanic/teichoic acid biosynthesis glycosyltransferase/membrane protein implicated in regulation of membrane protease activity
MFKRAYDILASGLGLLLLAPLLLLIALAIKLDSAGPVFFRQERVGRYGRTFRIFKFRTMSSEWVRGALQITVAGDSRITRVGAVLRRSKLDELPQLIDVLRGTMSLVGPRPEVPRYVEHYPASWRERLLSVRPGVTDFASVHYRDENELLARAANPEQEYLNVVLPAKLRYSLHYVDNPTIANDLHILGLTLRIVFAPAISSARSAMSIKNVGFWIKLEQGMSALRPLNRTCAAVADGLLVLLCWHVTYLFRLGFERWQPDRPWYDDYVSIGVTAVYLLFGALAGVPRVLWRFFGLDDFKRLTLACLGAGMLNACWILLAHLVAVPRAVLVLHPFSCILAFALARMVYRLIWEHARERAAGQDYEGKRAIVLGAGEAARRLVASIHRHEGWTVLAMLDDDPAKRGLRISGVSVQGGIADLALPHVLAGATHVLIAMPEADEVERSRAIRLARATELAVMTVADTLPMQTEKSVPASI